MDRVNKIKSYIVGSFRSFHNSDNCFVVMIACDRVVGIFTSATNDRLRPLKNILIACTIVYELLEFVLFFFFLKSITLEQHFTTLFLMFCRMLCVINWSLLALFRKDLEQIWLNLRDLQRNRPDPRRSKYIRAINWFALGYMIENMGPYFVWTVSGQVGSPIKMFPNDFLHQVNNVLYPVAVTLVTFMFCYCIIVICTILPALALEFMLLGTAFERIFEDVGSLGETIRRAQRNWDQLEQALKLCIEHHQHLLDMATRLKEQVKFYFLTYLITSFVIITFSCFQYALTQEVNSPRFTFTAAAAVTSTINLLLCGYLCDQLEGQVAAVKYHLYCSGWTDKLIYSRAFGHRYKAFRKMMLIVMGRTQQKVGMTCGNFAAMSLVTCRRVLQFAFSVLAVLLSFLD
ncbi:uncharacterized protein LOC135702114 [Ochlerotatus camptorhynchus]|uniref:uncharacterized protein LOC135702114 n=1 Tax=Ochlerotatus camptorhynchus TaxID=644619 RepID=UPI0031D18CF0